MKATLPWLVFALTKPADHTVLCVGGDNYFEDLDRLKKKKAYQTCLDLILHTCASSVRCSCHSGVALPEYPSLPPAALVFADSIKQTDRKSITQEGLQRNSPPPHAILEPCSILWGSLSPLCLGGERAGDN